MAETLLDALIKLNFEGEGAVGAAADAVSRIEANLKRISSLPGVNFKIGDEGLGKTVNNLTDVGEAYRRLIPLAEQAEAALREAGSGKGGGNTQRANNIAAITEQLRGQLGLVDRLAAAESRRADANISQSKAVEARMERQKRLIEEMLRLGRIDAMQAAQMQHGLAQGQSMSDLTERYVGTAKPSGADGRTHFERMVAGFENVQPGENDPVKKARGRLSVALERQADAAAALNKLDESDPKFKGARTAAATAYTGVLAANEALEKAIIGRAKAEAAAAEAARKMWETASVQTSQAYHNVRYANDADFMKSLGVDLSLPKGERAAQTNQALGRLTQAELDAKIATVGGERELGRVTAQRARVVNANVNAEETARQLAEKRVAAEKEREAASKDSRLAGLGMNADQYAASKGIDNGEPLTRQRIELSLQQNQLKQKAIAEEAKAIKLQQQDNASLARVTALDEQKTRLVQQEFQLRQQAAVLAAREKKAAGGSGGFLGGLFGKNEDDDGFGQGLAYSGGMTLRFYAMYAGFAALQQALAGVFQMTEQYTLAVHDLSVALGTSYDEAAKAGEAYTKAGAQFGAGPIESIQGATKGLRSFRNRDGSVDPEAGTAFARLAGIITTLEPEARRENSQQDIIAIAKAFKVGAEGLEGLYDKLLSVSHEYGYNTPGEILSGTAAVADIGKESGYTPEALAAAIASIMQGTGTTSDAAAGDLKRFFGAQNDPALIRLFSRYSIDQDGTLKQKLDQLAAKLGDVDPEQRARDLTALGGPRIASAINALIAGIPEANRAEVKAQDAGGSSAQQAQEVLGTLGGMMQKLGAELKTLFAAIANSGLGVVFVGLVQVITSLVTASRQMLDLYNQLPTAIKALVASLIILRAAAGAQAVLTGGAVGAAGAGAAGGILARLLPGLAAGGAGAAGGGLATFGAGGAALGPLRAAAAGAGASFAALGARLTGAALAVGGLVLALAPLAAVIGGIMLVSDAATSKQGQENAADAMVAGSQRLKQALNEDDPEKARAAIAQLEQAKKDASAAASTPGGVAMDVLTDVDNARAAAYAAVDAQIAGAQKEIDQIEEAMRLADEKAPRSEWFGKNYNNISNGVALIKAKGLGVDPATKVLGDLLLQNAQVVQNALQPGDGQEGAAALQEYILGRISSSNSPLTQERSYAEVSSALRAAKDRVASTGDATQIEALRLLQEQVDRQWAASVVQTTKAKIEVAQGGFTGKQSENQIRAILTEGLDKATQAEDVNAIVQLLNMADKTFIDQYKAAIEAQKIVLTSVQSSLNAALDTVGSAFQGIGGSADTGNVKNDIRNDMKDKAARHATSQFNNKFDAISKAFDEALKLATPTGSATSKPADDLAIARAQADATAGNGLEQAQASVKAAQIKVDALVRNGQRGTAAYYDALKALNDSKYALAQYELNKALAEDAAQVPSNNPIAAARNAVEAARSKLKAAVDPIDYWNSYKALQDAKLALAQLELQEAEARTASTERPNDPLAAAKNAIENARRRIAFNKGSNSVEYYNALRALHQAQYEQARIELEMANNQSLLGIDITDPVKVAQQRVKQASAQLAYDRNRGAGRDVLLSDEVALRQARSDASGQAWSQTFNDQRTNYDLNRISLSAYLKYLQSQHDYLTAVKNKTRQQIDQLNEVDSALKGLTESMQGQWNLGDIKVPTAYEMRRALTGGAQATSVSYVTITMTGSSTAEMKAALQGAIGQPILQTVGTAAPKV